MAISKKPPSVRGIPVSYGMSFNKLENAARFVVDRLVPGRDCTDPVPGVELFEELTFLDPSRFNVPYGRDQVIGLGGAVCDLPDGTHARTRYSRSEGSLMIELSDPAYEWLQRGNPRGLFTLWHELGHAYLHTKELLHGEYIEHATAALQRDGRKHEIFMDSEWQADGFAAAAIAPLELLRYLKRAGQLTPENLSHCTGISEEAAAYRIDNAQRKQGL